MNWLREHSELLTWLFALSIGSLLLTAALLPVIVVRLPADYFSEQRAADAQSKRRSIGRIAWLIAKNLLGLVFVLAGIAMLVLPGQGLLTIAIGLMLMDGPGKRRTERWFVKKRGILSALNKLRARFDRAPFVVD